MSLVAWSSTTLNRAESGQHSSGLGGKLQPPGRPSKFASRRGLVAPELAGEDAHAKGLEV